MASNLIRKEELVNNPTPRVPICLCLDTSGSMGAFEKYCARSFFFWMTKFLRSKYETVENFVRTGYERGRNPRTPDK